MMPISPENALRYPKDWKMIVAKVRERSGNRCEGSPAYPDCRALNGAWKIPSTGELVQDEDAALSMCVTGEDPVRIVLTTGHLNHEPEDCRLENLRHWCQRCHLTYDAKHHAQSAYSTRRKGKAIADIFDGRE